MVLFPWLLLILLLLLLAEVLIVSSGALRALAREHHLTFARPAMRLVIALTLLELAVVLVWGLVLRPR